MSIWNKILLGLIFFAVPGLLSRGGPDGQDLSVLGAVRPITFEKKLKEVNEEIVSLQTADHRAPLEDKTIGVQQLRIDLGRVLANRGRIWTKCEKKKAADASARHHERHRQHR